MPPRTSETILLVNDDPQVLKVIQEILRRCGYAVVTAGNFSEAARLLQQRPIDLLLADYVTPQMKEGGLIERLCTLRPGLKVLLMSAYNNGLADRFIQMPFTPEALARKVREVLDAPVEQPQKPPRG